MADDGDIVFGIPVTEGNRCERAQKAFNDPNANNKRTEAIDFVRNEEEHYGIGVSTLCIFYNATGEELKLVGDYSMYGRIYRAYPEIVQNGQWGAFLHVKTPNTASDSVGFAVYRGKYNDIDYCNMLLAWENPWNPMTPNHAYCDIFDDGYIDKVEDIYDKMEATTSLQHVVIRKGMFTKTNIEQPTSEEGTSPLYEAVLTLEHLGARQ